MRLENTAYLIERELFLRLRNSTNERFKRNCDRRRFIGESDSPRLRREHADSKAVVTRCQGSVRGFIVGLISIALVASLFGCESSSETQSSQSTAIKSPASSITTMPNRPPLSKTYQVDDWRYAQYIFYFIEKTTGLQLETEVHISLTRARDRCDNGAFSPFQMREVAEALDTLANRYLNDVDNSTLQTDIENSNLDLASVGAAGKEFPNDSSVISSLVKWWIVKCGEEERAEAKPVAPGNTIASPQGTNRPTPQNCAEWFQSGLMLRQSRCTYSWTNCRLIQEKETFNGFEFVKQYTFLRDINFSDGSVYRNYYWYSSLMICNM